MENNGKKKKLSVVKDLKTSYKSQASLDDFETSRIQKTFFVLNNWRKVFLNIGGVKHEILVKNLRKLSGSRLGKIVNATSLDEIKELCDDFDFERKEIFFDRDATIFSSILNFYRTGKLHILDNICAISFHDELLYWGINELFLESCCHFKFYLKKEAVLDEIKKDETSENKMKKIENFERCAPCLRKKIWDLTSKPHSSKFAKAFSIVSIFFVILSLTILVLSSIPEARSKTLSNGHNEEIINNNNNNEKNLNITNNNNNENNININNINNHSAMNMNQTLLWDELSAPNNYSTFLINSEPNSLGDNPLFEILEAICIGWFTFEYLIRLFSSPNKLLFVKSFLNLIDLGAILPYYITLIFMIFSKNLEGLNMARKIISLLRILRIMRLFKLARHSSGLKSLAFILKRSYNELGMLLFFLVIAVLFFSTLVYFAEHEVSGTQFVSIPASFWWAIITVTTVGYGDMIPSTTIGKLLSSACCIFGLLVIAMPITIIVNNFNLFYIEQRKREKLLKYKEEIVRENINYNKNRKISFRKQNSREESSKPLIENKNLEPCLKITVFNESKRTNKLHQ